MLAFRALALPLLGLALLAAPATAQTRPNKMARKPTSRMMPNPAAARAADPPRGTATSKGISGYAAPGEPINVKDNGKNTPPYDGPAAGHGTPAKSMTMPRKQ
ncbi:hypothetical protein HHL22_17355 [Hymenobacter sp. RP-2-7]|uniref:Uncharacterized protein n=1 Tax=Hymenobacter polaris TaxID=2682546 RepID=A0A7Y0FNV2_9BACT|nr:hypothetical protein [Hymenobacter polaris]NML66976.1 hypothetical protein [Hymenobacter polaris]